MTWVQRQNFINKSKEILSHFHLSGLKIVAYSVLLIYWVKALGPLPPNTSPISMFHGSRIRELAACGLTLEACCLGLDACRLMLEQVGSKA
jgi:hypothetical protein